MTEEQQRNELIAIGEEVKIFLSSPLGETITERAKLEVERAKDALSTVDPEDSRKIRELQNIIARFTSFDQWLVDIFDVGQLAYVEYVEEDSYNG